MDAAALAFGIMVIVLLIIGEINNRIDGGNT